MAILTVQTISRSGLLPSLVAAAGGGDEFANEGKTFLWVVNGDVSSKTVTLVTPQSVLGLAIEDLQVTVPASEQRLVGPLPVGIFNDANSRVQVTYSDVTSVTVAAVNM